MKIPRALGIFASLWTVVFWIGCVAIPVVAVLSRAGGVSTLGDPLLVATAWVTAQQALLSTLIAAAIGLPLGLWAAQARGRLAAWLDALLLLPASVPTVVAATAWVIWLGRSGWLTRVAGFMGLHLDLAYRLEAVILAHVFFNAPWIALLVAQARRAVPEPSLEAAQTLGARPFSVFCWVLWPQLRWAFAAACAQVFAFCSMSFALVLILGGGPPVETLETALYSRVRYGSLDLAGAAACAAWELLITLTPWVLVLAFRSRDRSSTRPAVASSVGRVPSPSVKISLLLFALFFIAPYFAVFFGSLSPWLDPVFWLEVRRPLALSFGLAALTGIGACLTAALAVLAGSFSPRRARAAVSVALALPSGVSVLVLGLGAWLAYGQWLDPFSGSLLAMAALQITVFFPLAFRMLWPVAQATQTAALEAAVLLGAGPARAFYWVEAPRWRGPLRSALALTMGAALGELSAVSLFYSENLIPLPLLVSRWMAQYRFEEARAVAALLFVGSAAVTLSVGVRQVRRAHV